MPKLLPPELNPTAELWEAKAKEANTATTLHFSTV